jgi:hypothetical protein
MKVRVDTDENGVQQSVQTELVCGIGNCGKAVDIRFNSLNTAHTVLCPEHGPLTTFPNREAFMEFSKTLTNKVLAAHGHSTITNKTQVGFIDDKPDPNSIN